MKKRLLMLCLAFSVICFAGSVSSCSKKTGCPMNEYTKKGKKGGSKKGKSNLFPKGMRKGK